MSLPLLHVQRFAEEALQQFGFYSKSFFCLAQFLRTVCDLLFEVNIRFGDFLIQLHVPHYDCDLCGIG